MPKKFLRETGPNGFEKKFKERLEKEFGISKNRDIIKMNPLQCQGASDLIILVGDKNARVEVKASKDSSHRPNQDLYIDMYKQQTYASFVYPENEEQVISELHAHFGK